MPTKIEKDEISGQETTGHEWDGIKELNTPLPKWWLYTFYACIAFSFVYVILYPAIPGFSGHTAGVLGYNSRVDVEQQIAAARAEQAEHWDAIAAAELSEIADDPDRMTFAQTGGKTSYSQAMACLPDLANLRAHSESTTEAALHSSHGDLGRFWKAMAELFEDRIARSNCHR